MFFRVSFRESFVKNRISKFPPWLSRLSSCLPQQIQRDEKKLLLSKWRRRDEEFLVVAFDKTFGEREDDSKKSPKQQEQEKFNFRY